MHAAKLGDKLQLWQRSGIARSNPRAYNALNRAYNTALNSEHAGRFAADNSADWLQFGGGLGLGELGAIAMPKPKPPKAPKRPKALSAKATQAARDAYNANMAQYNIEYNNYMTLLAKYQADLQAYNQAIIDDKLATAKRKGDAKAAAVALKMQRALDAQTRRDAALNAKYARTDTTTAAKYAHELAMQQAKNQALQYHDKRLRPRPDDGYALPNTRYATGRPVCIYLCL